MLKKDLLTNELIDEKWWISPLLVLFGLLVFIVYSTWAAWQGEYFLQVGEVFGWSYSTNFTIRLVRDWSLVDSGITDFLFYVILVAPVTGKDVMDVD